MTTAWPARGLAPEDWAACEAVIAAFAAAWRVDAPARIADFLPVADPIRTAVLVELVHTDVELRTRAGLPVTVPGYFAAYPELAVIPNLADDLVAVHVEWLFRSGTASQPPARLGPYELIREVGRGGSSVVYRGRDTRDGRTVAVKVLRPWVADDPALARRFAREVALAARLMHPGIAVATEFGREAGACYLVADFVEGVTFAAWIRAVTRTPREVITVMLRVAEAVSHAHDRGVLHRDLTPTNILVTEDGVPKVVDFGLAAPSQNGTPWTRSGDWAGTPAYMSPETLAGKPADVRSDVFALGAVLYESLTGCVPFPSPLPDRIRGAADPPPRPSRVNPLIPAALDAICSCAMEPSSTDRYPSVAAFSADLARYLAGRPVQVPRRKTRRWMHAGIAVFIVSGVVLAGVFAQNRYNAPVPPGDVAESENDPVAEYLLPLAEFRSQLRNDSAIDFRLEVLDRSMAAYRRAAQSDPDPYPYVRHAQTATLRADLLADTRPGTESADAAQHAMRAAWVEVVERHSDNMIARQGLTAARARVAVRLTEWDRAVPSGDEPARVYAECVATVMAYDAQPDAVAIAAEQLGPRFRRRWPVGDPVAAASPWFELQYLRGQLAALLQDRAECLAVARAAIRRAETTYSDPETRYGIAVSFVLLATRDGMSDPPGEILAELERYPDPSDVVVTAWSGPLQHRFAEQLYARIGLYTADGRQDDAIAVARRAAVVWARLAASDVAGLGDDRMEAVCLHDLGNLLEDHGDPTEAAATFRSALELRRKLADRQPDAAQYQLDRSASAFSQARVLERMGHTVAAIALYREAREAHERACRQLPNRHIAHRWLADRIDAVKRLEGTDVP